MVAKRVTHGEEVARMKQYLDGVKPQDPIACGVDVKGRRHDVNERYCENQVEDDTCGPYCEVLNHAWETKRMRKWTWMPEMLDYFWRHGVESDGFDFLEGSGFLVSYEYGRPTANIFSGLRFLTSLFV